MEVLVQFQGSTRKVGLSKTKKMPGPSFGFSNKHCKAGKELAKIKGSICSKCYAGRGNYCYDNVKDAQERRWVQYVTLPDDEWVGLMVQAIKRACKSRPWFRIFDSGDFQSTEDVGRWIEVARQCPQIRFWAPTQELRFVKPWKDKIPKNMVIRVSSIMIDDTKRRNWRWTSSSVRDKKQATCPAQYQDGKCGDCRRCWDKRVPHVVYPYK